MTSRTPPADFALLGHPANAAHLAEIVLHLGPGFVTEELSKHDAVLTRFLDRTPTYVARRKLQIELDESRSLSGRLVICTFLPERINSPQQMLAAYKKIRDGCRLAQKSGAKILGLGGFTSIVAGVPRLAREFEIAMTSGNTLTAALALEQLNQLLGRLEWDLRRRTVAVLGATGDIGRACTLALAPRVGRLVLVARNKARLTALHANLPARAGAVTSVDVQAALEADVIIAATSAPQPVLKEADLKAGTIVCDLGYPRNLSHAPRSRPEVLAFSGGLAETPFSLDLGYHTRLPAPSLLYGCYAETILLAMAGRYEDGSIGQGQITPQKMDDILALAQAHGFRPAPLYRSKSLIADDELETFLRRGGRGVG